MSKIPQRLIEKLNSLPSLPGIYKMKDSNGRIIYVGKSKCLKNRVRSYFTANHKQSKIEKMVSLIDDIEYIVTDTHLEALLLECELIKKLKPMFNTQLKNDEKYAYIKIEDYNIYNPLSVVNKREENTYGPFRRKFSLVEMINSLKNLYPIQIINGGYDFEYNLIPLTMGKDIYEENKSILQEIFSDDRNLMKLIEKLEEKMKEAASSYRFETASTYRDMIYTLNYLKSGIYGYKNMFAKNIILKIPIPNGYKLFFVSKGQILLKESYSLVTELDVKNFINKGKDLLVANTTFINEKASMDFRDILYSEIKSLPKEMVLILE
ncbi:GIY-YIG nuclease family protein [Tissierella sp.]|uniref:GIY-YIG nuclease family protein n=1 Tax=Tissierella sp. TaxID=41274 RepID=UPI002857A287|nr:GIY-YIG nuclease family protein [Tissierella sp.]MDR7855407.1 GIY-YIG nuclease family protein [Tissierella sp.]